MAKDTIASGKVVAEKVTSGKEKVVSGKIVAEKVASGKEEVVSSKVATEKITSGKVVAKTATKTVNKSATSTAPRMKELYLSTYAAELKEELGLANAHQIPRIEKIVINVGLGKAKDDKKLLDIASNTIKKITGQLPIETTARLSIASFKLREGNKIGLKVTLRGDRMYEFMDRVITLVLPRLRDFHGVSMKAFDGQGNYSLGLTDQSVFPELSFEETTTLHGLQINFVIRSVNPAHSRALLTKFGMPFEKQQGKTSEKGVK